MTALLKQVPHVNPPPDLTIFTRLMECHLTKQRTKMLIMSITTPPLLIMLIMRIFIVINESDYSVIYISYLGVSRKVPLEVCACGLVPPSNGNLEVHIPCSTFIKTRQGSVKRNNETGRSRTLILANYLDLIILMTEVTIDS